MESEQLSLSILFPLVLLDVLVLEPGAVDDILLILLSPNLLPLGLLGRLGLDLLILGLNLLLILGLLLTPRFGLVLLLLGLFLLFRTGLEWLLLLLGLED